METLFHPSLHPSRSDHRQPSLLGEEHHPQEHLEKGATLRPPAFQLFAGDAAPATPKPMEESSSSHPATGLPGQLRAGIEQLSGQDMQDVRVHYASSKPAQVGALAFAQGTEIHLAPGQDHLLPHEAWHVAQQKQGRVQATGEVEGNPLNEEKALEQEADEMGEKALSHHQQEKEVTLAAHASGTGNVMQRQVLYNKKKSTYYSDLDPELEFNTYNEALQYELEMEAPEPISGGRAPTLYTYLMTPSHRKMNSRGIPQGPHTIGYAALTEALFNARIHLEVLVNEQIPSPEQWHDLVEIEFDDDHIFDGQTETSRRLLRAYRAYNGLWQELRRIIDGKSQENPIDIIHELLQMAPYAVYGYVNPSEVKHKHLKYKGENRDLSNIKNIDTYGKFTNQKEYAQTVNNRMDLLDDDCFSDDMMSEDTLDFSSSDETMAEITEAVTIWVGGMRLAYWPDEVKSNGDCFFNTILLAGYGESVQGLRLIARNNGGQHNITTPGVYANESDITAVANHLGIQVRVVSIGLDNSTLQDSVYGNAGNTIMIAHIYGAHFTPLHR